MTMRCDRRTILAGGMASALATLAGRPSRAAEGSGATEGTADEGLGPLCVFAKHLQWLSNEALADLLVELDVAGIEATVRDDGQVKPEDARRGLPKLAEALDRRDRRIVIMTTGITSPDSPHAAEVLETAAKLGVRHYRMGYYQYDLNKPILPQLQNFTRQAERLAQQNRALGIVGVYQNHAGDRYVGAPLWDLRQMLESISPAEIAVAYDVRHATVEAGMSWPLNWAMIRPHVGAIFLKDFHWTEGKAENVPLGTGQVDPKLFAAVRDSGLAVPVSLHMEYIDHRDPDRIDECIAAYRADRIATRELLGI
ncbi:MAG: sugar phosphate isomerase/epimerase [Planctomycetaceae bacterium]|nr:MAG: sugar phosphate isomerase/epimerase [Planctomycetaceae bacterium]